MAQICVTTFSIVVMVRRFGAATGDKSVFKIKEIEEPLLAGMMGWSPAPGMDPVWWRGGRLGSLQTSAMWWIYEFSTRLGVQPGQFY
jgi:hypothetical protein